MVSVLRPLYNKLLGMAMLAMAIGGVMTSCSPNDGNEPTPLIPPIVVPVDTVTQSATPKSLVEMKTKLGLASVSTTDKVEATSIIRKGDVVAFGYHDDEAGCKCDFKINETESTKDNSVFYGTSKDLITGATDDIRRTISSTSNSVLVKEEVKINGEYVSRGTKEYIENSDKTYTEYNVKSDGTKSKLYVWEQDSLTSLTKKNPITGEKFAIDGIAITQK